MKKYLFGSLPLSVVLFVTLSVFEGAAQSQPLIFSDITPLSDSSRIAYLHQSGVQLSAGDVIAWFPKDSLSMEKMRSIVDTLNLGIQSVKAYIKAPLPWQRLQVGEHITFYFNPDNFISHTNGLGAAFVPFWRIKNWNAPWLHEACHEILAPANERKTSYADVGEYNPTWLIEGAAEFLALRVFADENLPKFRGFNEGSIEHIDETCLNLLKSSKGGYILSYIGSPGFMSELSGSERMSYAPAFYNCSCSFTKFLVAQYGLSSLMDVMGAFPYEQKKLKEITQRPPSVLRQNWLYAINASALASKKKYLEKDSLDYLLKSANIEADKIPLSKWFAETMKEQGIAVAIKKTKAAWRAQDVRYHFSEDYLNSIGYDLLDKNKNKEAIAVFSLNTEMYPNSANAYDSLAEAYLKDGQIELARKYYKKTLELNPNNDKAKNVLKNMIK
jgi:hypothetical protein